MKFLAYILVYTLTWGLYLLPDFILYGISDFFYLILYRIAGYRKKIVMRNLGMAFPEYSQEEINRIAKKFYHHLCDLILESAIQHHFSRERAISRLKFINPEILVPLFEKGKPVMAVTAHYGNWESLATISLFTEYTNLAIYKPLKNKYFDRQMQRTRNRFGVIPVPMEKIARTLMEYARKKEPTMTFFLSDQRPVLRQMQYWTKFMGIDTPIYMGTEKLARKLDAAVVFFAVRKVKRGRYSCEIKMICENPSELKPHEITDRHVAILEDMIREAPEYWLWSHNRWKYSYEAFLKRTTPVNISASPAPEQK